MFSEANNTDGLNLNILGLPPQQHRERERERERAREREGESLFLVGGGGGGGGRGVPEVSYRLDCMMSPCARKRRDAEDMTYLIILIACRRNPADRAGHDSGRKFGIHVVVCLLLFF